MTKKIIYSIKNIIFNGTFYLIIFCGLTWQTLVIEPYLWITSNLKKNYNDIFITKKKVLFPEFD